MEKISSLSFRYTLLPPASLPIMVSVYKMGEGSCETGDTKKNWGQYPPLLPRRRVLSGWHLHLVWDCHNLQSCLRLSVLFTSLWLVVLLLTFLTEYYTLPQSPSRPEVCQSIHTTGEVRTPQNQGFSLPDHAVLPYSFVPQISDIFLRLRIGSKFCALPYHGYLSKAHPPLSRFCPDSEKSKHQFHQFQSH